MTATTILVMRHAEKTGDPMDANLSAPGIERAERLAQYIPSTFGPIGFLFAAAVSKHSARPYQTIEPLSRRTEVPIDATFADQDYGALALTILEAPQYKAKSTVICWHHGNIPSLIRSLKARHGDYPDPWDPTIFNLILQLDYDQGSQVPNVTRTTEDF